MTRKVYCIDPFFDSYYAGNNYRNVYDHMVESYDVNKSIITIKGFATTPGKEVFQLTKDNQMASVPNYWFMIDTIETKLDFVFIDGDHSRDTALIDFVKSYQSISYSGVILIHDICDKLWEKELKSLLDYIKSIQDVKVEEYKEGINGIAVVKRKQSKVS